MISKTFAYYPPSAIKTTLHDVYTHGDTALVRALQAALIKRFDGRYSFFTFNILNPHKIEVQVVLDGAAIECYPGDYFADFEAIVRFCLAFEAGWEAARR